MLKQVVIATSILLSSIFVNGAAHANDDKAYYRGLLELAPGIEIVLGVVIDASGDTPEITLQSPNQGMYDFKVEDGKLTQDSISFSAPSLKASFEGSIEDDKITGVFTQGKARDIELTKLDKSALSRLEQERRWFGDLQVTPRSELPLVLAIAVTAEGYHATLDSPSQNGFGIPLTDFSISDDKLSFQSPMLSASYQATLKGEEWSGTFIQGSAMPLTFKKKVSQ